MTSDTLTLTAKHKTAVAPVSLPEEEVLHASALPLVQVFNGLTEYDHWLHRIINNTDLEQELIGRVTEKFVRQNDLLRRNDGSLPERKLTGAQLVQNLIAKGNDFIKTVKQQGNMDRLEKAWTLRKAGLLCAEFEIADIYLQADPGLEPLVPGGLCLVENAEKLRGIYPHLVKSFQNEYNLDKPFYL